MCVSTLENILGCFNPILDQIWADPNVGLKCHLKNIFFLKYLKISKNLFYRSVLAKNVQQYNHFHYTSHRQIQNS